MDGNPFHCDLPEDLDCHLKIIDGIVHVYKEQESVDRNEPFEWPYPDLTTFLADQNIMFALIADGPL